MPHLLYSAKGRDGKPVEGFVEAATAQQARQALLSRGLADVVLHQESQVSQDPRALAGLSAAQVQQLARLKLQVMREPGLRPVLAAVVRANRFWLLVDLAIAMWGVASGRPIWVATGMAFAALPFAAAIWRFRHGDRYLQVIKRYAIGDWAQVQALAQKLRGVSAGNPMLDFDLDIRLACIQARQGRLAEALASLEPWRARLSKTGSGLFETRIAAVHSSGEDRAGFVRLMSEAYELSNHEPARTLDLALALARFGDAQRAEDLLATIDPGLLPPHASGFLQWCRGLVQLRQGRPGALETLGAAVAEFLKLSQQPAVWTALAFCTCDHAVALNMAGSKDEARRELAQVWPIVRAHADKPLLRLLQADGLAPA